MNIDHELKPGRSWHARRAASMLLHYLANASRGHGPKGDEQVADIDALVDHIVAAAVEKMAEQEAANAPR